MAYTLLLISLFPKVKKRTSDLARMIVFLHELDYEYVDDMLYFLFMFE